MTDTVAKARALLQEFKGDTYAFGFDVLDRIGPFASALTSGPGGGKKAMFVGRIQSHWFGPYKDSVINVLAEAGLDVVDVVQGAAPNAPFVDVYRIHSHIMHKRPDVLVVMDSGSTIDAVKGFPTRLTDVPGITEAHLTRCLAAAKDPQLEMKLLNMPVPLKASQADDYMGPILQAAWEGRFDLMRSLD